MFAHANMFACKTLETSKWEPWGPLRHLVDGTVHGRYNGVRITFKARANAVLKMQAKGAEKTEPGAWVERTHVKQNKVLK